MHHRTPCTESADDRADKPCTLQFERFFTPCSHGPFVRGALFRFAPFPSRSVFFFVFPIYPIVVSGRLHLDIGDIVVGHFLLDGFDMLNQRVWAPYCRHVMEATIQLRG